MLDGWCSGIQPSPKGAWWQTQSSFIMLGISWGHSEKFYPTVLNWHTQWQHFSVQKVHGSGVQSKLRHSRRWKLNLQKILTSWLYTTVGRSIILWARGVLLQKVEGTWKPVAYASMQMSTREEHYAQIEKEALAITWACDKFFMYILGKHFEIETDHKLLVPLLTSDNLPPRILRFCLRMMKYEYSISHVPGKFLFTANTLSRGWSIPSITFHRFHQ